MQGRSRRRWLTVALVLLALAGAAWVFRTPLLSWYYVKQLVQADEANRENWLVRVVDQDEASVSPLLTRLHAGDGTPAVQEALCRLTQRWGPGDERALRLAQQLGDRFNTTGLPARSASLQVLTTLLLGDKEAAGQAAALHKISGEMVAAASQEGTLSRPTMVLLSALLERVPPGQFVDLGRNLAEQGLSDAEASTRVAAIQLVLRPGLKEGALLAKVAPLLRDGEPQVRKAALTALAKSPELVSEDDLLPLLHDPDVEVQLQCEMTLRSRGLQDSHIHLARAISDASPAARLQVLQHLRRADDLEPGVWLRRLTQDPTPAVRAAAVRAAANQPNANLQDRLHEMFTADPSPTVRQLAGHYLHRLPKK